jgi:hypothetical protein
MEVNPDDITEIEKDMGDFYQTVLELKSTSEILEEEYNIDVEFEFEKQLRWVKYENDKIEKELEEFSMSAWQNLKTTTEVLEERIFWPKNQIIDVKLPKRKKKWVSRQMATEGVSRTFCLLTHFYCTIKNFNPISFSIK